MTQNGVQKAIALWISNFSGFSSSHDGEIQSRGQRAQYQSCMLFLLTTFLLQDASAVMFSYVGLLFVFNGHIYHQYFRNEKRHESNYAEVLCL